MERRDNYLLQAQQAKQHFLNYDQQRLIGKLRLRFDMDFLYTALLSQPYRISRATGDLEKWDGTAWTGANTHAEVMTLLDLVCDSRENRFVSGRWKQMQSFGLMFHRALLEERDVWAERFQADTDGLRRACIALGGEPVPGGDVSYAIELFDGLKIWLQFWTGDEEFSPRLCWLWDENALMYLKYETMYFAVNLLKKRIAEEMKTLAA